MAAADSLRLLHPLLSAHPDLKVIREYGVVQHYLNGPGRLRARLAFFLIGKEGIVREKWLPAVQSALFPSDLILEKVRELAGKP